MRFVAVIVISILASLFLEHTVYRGDVLVVVNIWLCANLLPCAVRN